MKTDYSRRDVLTVGALALIGTAVTSTTTQAQTQAPDGAKTPKVGAFTDPTFPPPMISGFEEYRFPWALNVSALPMPGGHHA